MKRWLFTFASALSLVLCLATAWLWLDSRDAIETLGYARWRESGSGGTAYHAALVGTDGRVAINLTRWEFLRPRSAENFRSTTPPGFQRSRVELAPIRDSNEAFLRKMVIVRDWWRFRTARISNSHVNLVSREAMAPAWFVMLLFLIAPAGWVAVRLRGRRRRRDNRCQACRYDLRASRDRCPECGTPVPKKAAATGANPQG